MILGWLAMMIFACHASTHMVAAGDTWVAMACGRHFINHGVDTVEPFSANSHKPGPTAQDIKKWPKTARWIAEKVGLETVQYWHPTGWVNQNWLTHVIFYRLATTLGSEEEPYFDALVYWKFALYIITVICVYYSGRLLGANGALSAFFACFAMFVGRSYLDVRPAGFSNILVAMFLLVLILTTYRNVLYIWLIVPMVVFWCNVHGGYIYAFIMLVPFVGLNFLTNFSQKSFVSIGRRGLYHSVGAGLTAFVAAIILNPFHLTNLTHTYLISVSKHAEMWRMVREWHCGFEWSNRVGTSFPFLVLFILCIGLGVFWLFSRLLKPRFLKAPKNELNAQEKMFTIVSKIFGIAAAIFICWATFLALSFIDLDALSFVICAAFAAIVLLSVYKSVHFIYLVVPLVLSGLWIADAGAGYEGRYIYPFITLPVYLIVHILACLFSKNAKIIPKNITFVVLTSLAAVVLMLSIFNPFGFESSAWNFEQFLHLKRMWRPGYEGPYPPNYKYLFAVLYFLNIASVMSWFAIVRLRETWTRLPVEASEQSGTEAFELPKIDAALLVIVALTVYMAVRSRRFIPIAAIAACPVLAMFIDQMARTISAARSFHQHKTLTVRAMPEALERFFIIIAGVAVLCFGSYWGLKFKQVYLDPWPTDTRRTSVFMRMTASEAKPFDACEFIKANRLEGKMFNYWTEGGFIAWGQEPDPNSGRTPLQLFMEGRAQAAYEPDLYRLWSTIIGGGPVVHSAMARRHRLTNADYVKVGEWVDQQLTAHDVWVVLMPTGEAGRPFMKGLERNANWQLVFFNNKQQLYVNRQRARQFFKDRKTILYPDEFSKNLITAHNMLLMESNESVRRQALALAIRAFELRPSQVPMREIILAARFGELMPRVTKFCQKYFDDFAQNKDALAKEPGYHSRITAALIAIRYLQDIAGRQGKMELVESYSIKRRRYEQEREDVLNAKRW